VRLPALAAGESAAWFEFKKRRHWMIVLSPTAGPAVGDAVPMSPRQVAKAKPSPYRSESCALQVHPQADGLIPSGLATNVEVSMVRMVLKNVGRKLFELFGGYANALDKVICSIEGFCAQSPCPFGKGA
jgi:hypothetical protein